MYDVVIVGGGMVGVTLACALGNSGLKISVVERTRVAAPPGNGYDLRVSAVTLASRAIFEAVGAWSHMEHRRVSPLRQMHVWDAGGFGAIHFDSADIGEPCLGYIIENSVIVAALLERLNQFTDVNYLCPAEIVGIAVNDLQTTAAVESMGSSRAAGASITLTLKGGGDIRTRLLVGADGPDSLVRRAAGIETRGFSFKQKGIVATTTTEIPHDHTAWQRFLPTGPVAFLPLIDAHTSSIVWSADTALADELLALDNNAFVAELQAAFGDKLGKIISVSRRAAFPLALSHATRYTAPRIALVGDAAHTVHPLAGQGVNLGFLDAATLADVLLDVSSGTKDIGASKVLRRYERWRKADNLTMLAVTGGFKYLFGNTLPGISGLRNLGLNIVNATTPLKNLIIRRASGLDGDLPRLARRNS